MSIQVNDFQWKPGKNDAEYIKLLESSRDEWQKIVQKAIAKLKALSKAQEARVMGVDEVWEWVRKQRVDREPICIEVKDNICAWIVSDEYWDMQMDIDLSGDLYGKTWRCWTSYPTAAQRKAVKWE